MAQLSGNPRAWLELLRISNLPTVLSNVLVGIAIGCPHGTFAWPVALVMAGVVGLFYLAGMSLNDVADAKTDQVERPSRPIPSGRITRRSALLFVTAASWLAICIAGYYGLAPLLLACGLVSLIVAYNLLHRITQAAILLMGACRGMVYLVAAAAVTWPLTWALAGPLASLLTAYTVAISLVARSEADKPWRIAIVHGMLAGISLLDMIFLLFLGQFVPAAVAFGCFGATVLLHRVIKGT